MKITKRSYIFHLLILSAFGLMLSGCDAGILIVGGGAIFGGIIGSAVDHVFIGIIGGIVIAIILAAIIGSMDSGSSYTSNSSSSDSSSSSNPVSFMKDYIESRKNGPHICGNCGKYGPSGCGRDGRRISPEDSCPNWD